MADAASEDKAAAYPLSVIGADADSVSRLRSRRLILGDSPIPPSGSLPDSAIAFLPVSPPSVADTTAEGQATAFSLNVSDDGDDSDRVVDNDCGRPLAVPVRLAARLDGGFLARLTAYAGRATVNVWRRPMPRPRARLRAARCCTKRGVEHRG